MSFFIYLVILSFLDSTIETYLRYGPPLRERHEPASWNATASLRYDLPATP